MRLLSLGAAVRRRGESSERWRRRRGPGRGTAELRGQEPALWLPYWTSTTRWATRTLVLWGGGRSRRAGEAPAGLAETAALGGGRGAGREVAEVGDLVSLSQRAGTDPTLPIAGGAAWSGEKGSEQLLSPFGPKPSPPSPRKTLHTVKFRRSF